MKTPERFRIVYLEDDESAFDLVRALLAAEGPAYELVHVFDEEGFRAALGPVAPDAILSDYNLPTIDGLTALELRRELCPATPFIFVSGALGEARAIDLLKAGVTDFVLKDAMPRLVPSIRRCLAEAKEHRDRMQAERSLRESEARFRRLAENAPDVIFRYQLDAMPGRCEFISAAVERICGYRPAEFYARPLLALKIVHPGDREIIRALIERREMPAAAAEIRWVTRDGRTIVTEQRFVPVHAANGQLVAVEGIARDITERKRTEQQVSLLSRAIAESPVGVDITDADGRFAFVSEPLCAMSGYARADLLGQDPSILLSPRNAPGFHAELCARLDRGQTWQGEIICRRRDGTDYVVRASMTPLRDEHGRVRHCIAVKEDITAWKAEQEGRRSLETQLFQAQKMESIGTLAGGIAHDFNNILTGILGFTEIAALSLKPADPARGSLEEVRKAGLRARDLVAQILTFSRQTETRHVTLDLARAVGEALKFLRASAPATIKLERRLVAGTVSADPTQIHQIVLNLCTNALHAMHGGPGTLFVAVERVELDESRAAAMPRVTPGSYLCLLVRDTGHGMDEATLRRVFDPFFTTKQPGEGTGLGLAVVQGIVAAHGGGVTVESQAGVGSTLPGPHRFRTAPPRSRACPSATSNHPRHPMIPVPLRLVARILPLLAALMLTLLPRAHAQTATGTIQGRVFNPTSGEYVRNAEVRLAGSNRVAYSENDGTFTFTNVPAGPASITVTFTGYNSATETFTVAAGQTAVREINLVSAAATPTGKDGVVTLQAFTVATEREGNAKAIMDQRRNMDISTSVSSDIFGDVADGNVGEFLKYLPGVDLDYVESEARGPRLGGMDAQYVGVSFDGQRTASADANRGGGEASRATSFEGFSITAIESIEINRTTSAESDADSPAGTINMKTKRAFDRKGRRVAFNAAMNFNAEEFTLKKTPGPRDGDSYKWKPNLTLDYSESFLNQRLGILLSASRANSYTEQYQVSNTHNRSVVAADPRPYVIRQIDFKDGNKTIQKDAYMLTADFRATRRLVLSLNAIYTYTEGEFWNRNFTWVAANDNANVNNGRARVGGDGLTSIVATRAATGAINNVATLNNGGGSSSKLTYTRTLSPKFEYKVGSWIVDGALNYSRSVNNYESLERGWINSEGGGVPSSWTATRPSAESWEWTIRQTSGNDWYNRASFVDTNTRSGGTRVNNDDRTWITTLKSGQLNARWAVPFLERFPTVLKFGGKVAEEGRDNNNHTDWNMWSYVGPGGNTTTTNAVGANINNSFGNWANLGFISPHPFDMGTTNGLTVFNSAGIQGMPPRVDRERVLQLFRSKPEQFVHMGNPDNYYTAFIANKRDFLQTISAAYLQADIRVGPKLQIRTGVRLENTLNEVEEFDPRLRADLVARGFPVNAAGRATTIPGLQYQYESQPRITRESEYHNYFPSIVLKYQILRNFEFQAGFNRAISRPPIDSLTGLWVVDEVNERVSAPNPNLPPEHSKNFQTRLAYYFSGRSPGQLSAAFSQNQIRNLRETFDFTASEFGVEDEEFALYTFRTTRISAESRRFRNMELSYNQTLGFLPEKYRGTSLNFAYTRSYASQRRNNLSPHRLTSRLGYAYKKFNGSIGMVWRDDSPDGIYGRYKEALTQFDLALTWKLTNRYSMYVQGRNITGKPVKWMESPPGVIEGVTPSLRVMQEYGANWVFGVRGTF